MQQVIQLEKVKSKMKIGVRKLDKPILYWHSFSFLGQDNSNLASDKHGQTRNDAAGTKGKCKVDAGYVGNPLKISLHFYLQIVPLTN